MRFASLPVVAYLSALLLLGHGAQVAEGSGGNPYCYGLSQFPVCDNTAFQMDKTVLRVLSQCSQISSFDRICKNVADKCQCQVIASITKCTYDASNRVSVVEVALPSDCTTMPAFKPDLNLFCRNGAQDGFNCPTNARRRNLLTDNSIIGGDADDENYLQSYYNETCGGFDYDGSLLVLDAHLYAVAAPKEAAATAGCPTVAAHAVFGQGDEVSSALPKKQWLIWKGSGELAEESVFKHGALPIGSFKLSDLVDAYQNAEPGASTGATSSVYDAVTNNCGNFIVSLASELGIRPNSRMTSFVARRLFEQSGTIALVSQIRESLSFGSLFGQDRHLRSRAEESESDEQVIELLVEKYASEV